MIVIVAPYSPVGLSDRPSLGAARKIETIVGLLARLDNDVFLVNTAHNHSGKRRSAVGELLVGDIKVKQLVLTSFPISRVGKAINLLQVNQVVREIRRQGTPRLVWLYNGYAFESLFAKAIHRYVDCPIILEFEDWHFSRRRGLNPKPYLDYLAWRNAISTISAAFSVNSELARRVGCYGIPVRLLPGIVSEPLAHISRMYKPFIAKSSITTVGYFGGLSSEKGVDVVLELVDQLPAGIQLVISGSGPLEAAVAECSRRHPKVLSFHGQVSVNRLYQLIAQCDVILNLHKPISDMHDGVFPFKVIEAIASGRLLISTALPKSGLDDVLASVRFCNGTVNELIEMLLDARAHYEKYKKSIEASASAANERFSEASVLAAIQEFLLHHSNVRITELNRL